MWAIAVGKAHIILVYDDFEMIGEAIGEVFVFWRKSDGKMVFVLLNMTSARVGYKFPENEMVNWTKMRCFRFQIMTR